MRNVDFMCVGKHCDGRFDGSRLTAETGMESSVLPVWVLVFLRCEGFGVRIQHPIDGAM